MQNIEKIIRNEQDFLIIGHISPDGDTIGSGMALLLALQGLGKSAIFVIDGKVVPDVVRLTSEGVKPRCVTLPNNLIKECGAFDIRYPDIAVEQIADIVKVPAGIKRIPQFLAKLVGVVAHTAVKVHKRSVEIVVNLKFARALMKQYPSATAEHLDIPVAPLVKSGDNGIPKRLLAANP